MKRAARVLAASLLAAVVLASCRSPVPHLLWPQKDLEPAEYNDPSLPRRLLVAARRSDFKAEVVRLLVDDLRGDRVYIRVIGVNQLRHAAANQYQAVVIVSTTMAWTLDPKVTRFLERMADKSRVVLITTSSDGEWLPGKDAYDALSAASRIDDAARIAPEAAAAVRRRLAP